MDKCLEDAGWRCLFYHWYIFFGSNHVWEVLTAPDPSPLPHFRYSEFATAMARKKRDWPPLLLRLLWHTKNKSCWPPRSPHEVLTLHTVVRWKATILVIWRVSVVACAQLHQFVRCDISENLQRSLTTQAKSLKGCQYMNFTVNYVRVCMIWTYQHEKFPVRVFQCERSCHPNNHDHVGKRSQTIPWHDDRTSALHSQYVTYHTLYTVYCC